MVECSWSAVRWSFQVMLSAFFGQQVIYKGTITIDRAFLSEGSLVCSFLPTSLKTSLSLSDQAAKKLPLNEWSTAHLYLLVDWLRYSPFFSVWSFSCRSFLPRFKISFRTSITNLKKIVITCPPSIGWVSEEREMLKNSSSRLRFSLRCR